MPIVSWCQWLQNTSLSTSIRQSDLLFPLIEGSHILALSISVGLIVILDLRFLGLAFPGEPVSRVMKQVMPWSLLGFAAMLITGLLLFMTQAEKAYGNAFFRIKLLLLLLAGLNALYYQLRFYPKMREWDIALRTPVGVRVCAVLSLVLWVGVIACGRTMAYEI
jgi:uncharacterized protein DUF6644